MTKKEKFQLGAVMPLALLIPNDVPGADWIKPILIMIQLYCLVRMIMESR